MEEAIRSNDSNLIISLADEEDVDRGTSDGHSLLYLAVSLGYLGATSALTAIGAHLEDEEVPELIEKAYREERMDMVEALMISGIDFDDLYGKKQEHCQND